MVVYRVCTVLRDLVAGLWVCIDLINADPDPAFFLIADQDPDPNADPAPGPDPGF